MKIDPYYQRSMILVSRNIGYMHNMRRDGPSWLCDDDDDDVGFLVILKLEFLGKGMSKDSGVLDDDIFWLIRWLLLRKDWSLGDKDSIIIWR